MPYASRRQARWANATGQSFAKRWNKLTNFGALPEKKDSASTGMAIPPTGNNALFNQPGVGRVSNRRKNKKIKDCDCGCMQVEKAVSSDTPVGAPAKKPTAPAGPAAAAKPAGAGQPGELLSPGVRRIRGNLCNVHGKYGPCDGAKAKPKKGPKGRGAGGAAAKPKKPPKTDEQRAAERDAKRTANADAVAKRMAENDTGLSPSGVTAMQALASGAALDPKAGAGLVKMGLAEQADDGSFRMSPTGRAAMNAMAAGDYQRAVDTISGAGDKASARQGRQDTAAAKRTASEAKRTAAQAEREAAKKKRDEERASAKPGKGGSSGPAEAAQSAAGKLAQRRAGRSGASGGGGGGGGGAGSTSISPGKKPEAAPKPTKEQVQATNRASVRDEMAQADQGLAPGGFDNLMALGGGKEPDGIGADGLISMGMADRGSDGTLRLTVAGRGVIAAANRGDTKAAVDLISRAGDEKKKTKEHTARRWHITSKAETYGGTKRSNLDDNVFAGPDRSFPIKTAQDVRDAVMSLGRTKHDKAAVKKGIIRRARAIGAIDALPEDWRTEKADSAGSSLLSQFRYSLQAIAPAADVSATSRSHLPARPNGAFDTSIAPSFTVFKDSHNVDRWLAITTTAYEDKDREIISRNAIKEAVALGDKTKERGPLLFWHVPGLVMGECDFQAQGGPGDRFLIEGGTFRNKAMASLGQKLSDSGYQMSPGFIHTDDQPSNGVYDHILIYERSAVPQNRAANYFTRYATAKEDKVLAPEKIAEYREKAAGNAEALAMLDSLLATAQKDDDTAQARNVVYKEAPEEITIGGVVYTVKAFPPAAADEETATEDVEVEAEQADDGMTGEPEPDGDEGMDDAAFAQMIAQAVVQAILQELGPRLDIGQKFAEIKDIVGGFATKKDDAAQAQATVQAQEVATLKAKVDELTGDLPTSVMNGARNYYRASESIATQLTPQAAATVKEAISNVPAGLTDPNEIAAYKLIFG